MPSRVHISICRDNDLQDIDAIKQHLIRFLFGVLDHIMELRQNTEEDTGFQPVIASEPQISKDNSQEYKSKYIICQAHSVI